MSCSPQCHFPYRECNRDDRLDGLLVEELKETWCHLDVVREIVWGVRE